MPKIIEIRGTKDIGTMPGQAPSEGENLSELFLLTSKETSKIKTLD